MTIAVDMENASKYKFPKFYLEIFVHGMTETTRNDNLTITSGDSDVDIQLRNIVRSKSEPGGMKA